MLQWSSIWWLLTVHAAVDTLTCSSKLATTENLHPMLTSSYWSSYVSLSVSSAPSLTHYSPWLHLGTFYTINHICPTYLRFLLLLYSHLLALQLRSNIYTILSVKRYIHSVSHWWLWLEYFILLLFWSCHSLASLLAGYVNL